MGKLGYRHTDAALAKMSAAMKGKCGPLHNTWRGGVYLSSDGYVRIKSPNHPFADPKGYVFEHRLVMEARLGRTLLPGEVVHHINGIRDDNRIGNLMMFSSNGEHMKVHKRRQL